MEYVTQKTEPVNVLVGRQEDCAKFRQWVTVDVMISSIARSTLGMEVTAAKKRALALMNTPVAVT